MAFQKWLNERPSLASEGTAQNLNEEGSTAREFFSDILIEGENISEDGEES